MHVARRMARLCADDSEHRRNVHRLLDSVLRRPSVQHLDRVPPFDPRLRLRVGRDAGAVQQRNQPGHLRLLQRTPQARPGRGLLPAPSPTTGRPTALQAFGYSIMVYRGREVSIHPPPQKKKRSTFRLAPVPCLGPEAPAGSKRPQSVQAPQRCGKNICVRIRTVEICPTRAERDILRGHKLAKHGTWLPQFSYTRDRAGAQLICESNNLGLSKNSASKRAIERQVSEGA